MCEDSHNNFKKALRKLETQVDESTERLQNILTIHDEMHGENRGLFMDHEREGMEKILNGAKQEMARLREELDAKVRYYNTEIKSMETVVKRRYEILDQYNSMLTQTPACASLLAQGQLELEQELERRKGL